MTDDDESSIRLNNWAADPQSADRFILSPFTLKSFHQGKVYKEPGDSLHTTLQPSLGASVCGGRENIDETIHVPTKSICSSSTSSPR